MELARLDDVGREPVAVDAARVEADGARAAARRGRRPVAEERDALAFVDLVPGRARAALAVGAERAQRREVVERLLFQSNPGPQ